MSQRAGRRDLIRFNVHIQSHWFSVDAEPNALWIVTAGTAGLPAAEICIYSSHARGHVTPFGHVIDERGAHAARAIKRFVNAGCRRNRSSRYRVAFCRQWCDCRRVIEIKSALAGPPALSYGHSPDATESDYFFVVGERCVSRALKVAAVGWKIDATLWTPLRLIS